MKAFREFLKRYSFVAGILLIFLFTWPIDMAILGWLPFKVPYVLSLIYGWGHHYSWKRINYRCRISRKQTSCSTTVLVMSTRIVG